MAERRLHRDMVARLHDLVIRHRLDRDVLFAGVDRRFFLSIRVCAMPIQQLLLDLDALNGTKVLADGSDPFRSWLGNARMLLESSADQATIDECLIELSADDDSAISAALSTRRRDHSLTRRHLEWGTVSIHDTFSLNYRSFGIGRLGPAEIASTIEQANTRAMIPNLPKHIRDQYYVCQSRIEKIGSHHTVSALFRALAPIYDFPAASIEFVHPATRSIINTYYRLPYDLAGKIVDVFPLDPVSPAVVLIPAYRLAVPHQFGHRPAISEARTPIEQALYPHWNIVAPFIVTIHDPDGDLPFKASLIVFQSARRLATQAEQFVFRSLSREIGRVVKLMRLPLITRPMEFTAMRRCRVDHYAGLAYVILSADGRRLLEASYAGLDACVSMNLSIYDLSRRASIRIGEDDGVLIIL